MSETIRASCPSAPGVAGNSLLGIVKKNGKVFILEQAMPVDGAFIATANIGRTLSQRFRFTASCKEGACQQWAKGRCAVGDKAVSLLEHEAESKPALCGIRVSCRWFLQSGDHACEVCPQVITGGEATSF